MIVTIFIMSNVQHLKTPIKVHSIILFSLIHIIILFAENVKQFNLLLSKLNWKYFDWIKNIMIYFFRTKMNYDFPQNIIAKNV